jgi:hypothetical protein
MVTAFNLIYSVSAVRRLLGLANDAAVTIRQFAWVVWVWVKGKRPTFISKKVFKLHFVDRRKVAAQALSATQWFDQPNRFTVYNESKESVYVVECSPTTLQCTCDDYSNQIKFIGRGCCKHGYAVLNQLGYSSLSQYIQALGSNGYLRSQAA